MTAPPSLTYDVVDDLLPILEKPIHTWTVGSVEDWLVIGRDVAGNFRLNFDSMAEFSVNVRDRSIQVLVSGDQSDVTIGHLFQNQVIPLLRSAEGELVLHGSGVLLESAAVAFLGLSGMGKSTLAAAFASQGQPLISDDALYVKPSPSGGYCLGTSLNSVRLWSDSKNAVLPNLTATADVNYTTKLRVRPQGTFNFVDAAQPLKCIYVLADASASAVFIARLQPSAVVHQLLKNTFILDIKSPATVRRVFQQLVDLVRTVPCFSLNYPRDYGALSEVMRVVSDHAAQIEAQPVN